MANIEGRGKGNEPGQRRAHFREPRGDRRFKDISTARSADHDAGGGLLDEEIAAGIVAAKQVQQRFQKERRIDPRDFREALQRFQRDGHEVVDLIDHQLAELRSKENAELTTRLLHNRTISSTSPSGSSTWVPRSPVSSPTRTSRSTMTARTQSKAQPLIRCPPPSGVAAGPKRSSSRRSRATARSRPGPCSISSLATAHPISTNSSRPIRAAAARACAPRCASPTCGALGGSEQQSLNSAVATELFHNAFLLHDDVQDGSLARRGGATLYREHGVGIAVNVGNATNLLALQRVIHNRSILGPETSWHLVRETERMMRHSLEGQAIELGWIRDNVCRLEPRDYLHMCLKKTSWYSFIYPLRAGALVAEGALEDPDRFCRFGWYVGAAFQVRDDVLNLTGKYARYGKEIGGDLWEGKRTLMLIHLLGTCAAAERRAAWAVPRQAARPAHHGPRSRWVYDLMERYESIEFARRAARQLAGAALLEALTAFRGVPDSEYKRFILEMVLYVVRRDR